MPLYHERDELLAAKILHRIQWEKTVSALAVGVFTGLFVILSVATLASGMLGGEGTVSSTREAFNLKKYLVDGLLQGSLLSALLETAIFVLIARMTGLEKGAWIRTAIFLLVIFFLGWLFHGATLLTIAKGLGFVILAVWYAHLLRRSDELNAVVFTFVAHASWNATVYTLWALRAVLAH